MWSDILTALALVLVIEGLMPVVNPEGWQRMLRLLATSDPRQLRIAGLSSMIVGALLLALVR